MSTDEYTPSEEWAYIRNAYARSQKNETFGSEEETEDARGEALREFDDTLAAHDARVRRDAAREALDGLAAKARRRAAEAVVDGSLSAPGLRVVYRAAEDYRDTHYPETEEQT